jgi:hypothetical protein
VRRREVSRHVLKAVVQNEIVLGARLKALALLFIKLCFAWKNSLEERLEGYDKAMHGAWGCCDLHQGLKNEHDTLKEMAEAFGVESERDTLSQAWFEDLAKQYNIEIPTEGRPSRWY